MCPQNLDFTEGFLHWRVSREGEVRFDIEGKEKALRIVFNRGVWSIEHKSLFPVKVGEQYELSAEVRCRFANRDSVPHPNHVSIAAEMLDSELKPVQVKFEKWSFGDPGEPFMLTNLGDWRCSEINLCGIIDWRNVFSFFRIPEGTRFMKLSIKGRGSGEFLARNLGIGSRILEALPKGSAHARGAPGARMCNKIPLGDYAAKVIRIGDLNGDGRPEYVFAQNEIVGSTPFEDYRQISCLTAIDGGGRILWQKGDQEIDNFDVTSDLPVAVLDINGDGKDEVVCCMNFKLQILDGTTGKVLKSTATPHSKQGGGFIIGHETLFSHILGDCITFCDLQGLGRNGNMILKDRYNDLWSYTVDLEQLWNYSGKLAHSPLVWDFDEDGRDEVFAGDALLDDDGKVLWRLELYDHCDSAVFYRHGGRSILCIANQNGGFYFLDATTGEVIREWHLGHAQVLSLGNFDADAGSRLICAQTYWGGINQLLFNLDGDLIFSGFGEVYGWVPVNWTGDGSELLAAPKGLFDCYGNLVVEFPDPPIKGRWGAKVYAWDICGDVRDEVLVWDESHLTIYTQVDEIKGRVYRPHRRLYNQSFYGNIISEPGWNVY